MAIAGNASASSGAVEECMSSTKVSGITILNAKLHRPWVTRELIVRPRLLESLDAGLARPLTVVVAPAGFGKSTLVSSWIEGAGSWQARRRWPGAGRLAVAGRKR